MSNIGALFYFIILLM